MTFSWNGFVLAKSYIIIWASMFGTCRNFSCSTWVLFFGLFEETPSKILFWFLHSLFCPTLHCCNILSVYCKSHLAVELAALDKNKNEGIDVTVRILQRNLLQESQFCYNCTSFNHINLACFLDNVLVYKSHHISELDHLRSDINKIFSFCNLTKIRPRLFPSSFGSIGFRNNKLFL